jgi:Tfp pilus assembly protein PilE
MRREVSDMSNQVKKSKIRLNVIDVMIILLVIALIATVVYRVYTGVAEKTNNKGSKYTVVFECDAEYKSMLKYLAADQAVYFESDGKLLGYLFDAVPDDEAGAVYEYEQIVTLGTGDYKEVSMRGQLLLSSEATKAKTGGYYIIGGRNITEGSTIEVYTNETSFTLTVLAISAIE